jgi:hypothetical protein
MKALRRIHDAGFVQCRTGSGDIFLVDLENSQPPEHASEIGDEMNEVGELYVPIA